MNRTPTVVALAGIAVTALAAGAAAAGFAIGRATAGLPHAVVALAGGATMLVAFLALAHVLGVREVAAVAAQLRAKVRRGNAN